MLTTCAIFVVLSLVAGSPYLAAEIAQRRFLAVNRALIRSRLRPAGSTPFNNVG